MYMYMLLVCEVLKRKMYSAVEQKTTSEYVEGNTDRVTGCMKSLGPTVSTVCVFLTMGSCPSK